MRLYQEIPLGPSRFLVSTNNGRTWTKTTGFAADDAAIAVRYAPEMAPGAMFKSPPPQEICAGIIRGAIEKRYGRRPVVFLDGWIDCNMDGARGLPRYYNQSVAVEATDNTWVVETAWIGWDDQGGWYAALTTALKCHDSIQPFYFPSFEAASRAASRAAFVG